MNGFSIPADSHPILELPYEINGANYRIIFITERFLKVGGSSHGSEILELDVRNIQAGIYIFEDYDSKRALFKRFIKN